MPYAQVAVACPLHQVFTYIIPENLAAQLKPGQRLVVPFRKKEVIGFFLSITTELPPGLDEKKLKEIIEIRDEVPVFSEKMIRFLLWLSDYYMAPIGTVCAAALPSKLCQVKSKNAAKPRVKEDDHAHFHQKDVLNLNGEQQAALDFLIGQHSKEDGPRTALIHGITGSGKTEVYLQFITEILKKDQQAILLVPEIGLTPQLIGRVQSRLDEEIAVYHSGLTETQRQLYWEKMRQGKLRVAVGTRSALFAPFQNLGAIIIDEEHDGSYKQGDGGFFYHARDAAIVRGKLEGATVVLGSATPSLESFHNAKQGKYHYIQLSERATGAKLPEVSLIDLRQEKFAPGSKTLSPTLKNAISENLYRGEQTLLFLNRRGYAHFIICEDCGKAMECPNCAITLTYHKNPSALVCHYCDYRAQVLESCPHCKSSALKPLGQGTEALEEELRAFFPEAKVMRLDRDTAGKRDHRNNVLHQMKKGTVDILLGTQIVAKGHDFPNVTLVGVILADASLHLPDFRSAERTFQLLTQVAGRSGRADKPGKVLIQTFHPEHFSLLCARDHQFETFSAKELQSRQDLDYPPFSRLTQIRLQGISEQNVEETALSLKKFLSNLSGISGSHFLHILGPAPAPLTKVRGKYRWHFLVKSNNPKRLKHLLEQTRHFAQNHLPPKIQLSIDVDCLHLM
ncbi:MAG: primosomal protein N' [Deltaproteobacteria bacterium]|nr:primosomal protein N' [Deltaproteobacteria bacterium]